VAQATLALQVRSPKFKPQFHQKKKKRKENAFNTSNLLNTIV
jgi:hypothetical protein